MVPPVVVVVDEVGNCPLKLAREFIRDLVHFPLDALVVALHLSVSLGMKWGRQDMPDTNEVEIIAEGPADIAPLSESSLVRSSTGTSVIPVASTASWITSMRELADMSFCSFQARMKRE